MRDVGLSPTHGVNSNRHGAGSRNQGAKHPRELGHRQLNMARINRCDAMRTSLLFLRAFGFHISSLTPLLARV